MQGQQKSIRSSTLFKKIGAPFSVGRSGEETAMEIQPKTRPLVSCAARTAPSEARSAAELIADKLLESIETQVQLRDEKNKKATVAKADVLHAILNIRSLDWLSDRIGIRPDTATGIIVDPLTHQNSPFHVGRIPRVAKKQVRVPLHDSIVDENQSHHPVQQLHSCLVYSN